MSKSFTKNYLKIYFWQFLGIFVSIISTFIVMPKLTNNQVFYGIYSLCVSISLYSFYLDFGFLTSAIRYANIFLVKGDKIKEIEVSAFGLFLLLMLLLIFALIIFIFSYNPNLLLNGIINKNSFYVARKLLIICGISILLNFFYRFINLVLEIRIENFIFYRIYIIGNVLKILSSFYFFSKGKQEIVSYYFFYQSIDFLVYLICIFIIKKKYNYDFILFFKSFKFSNKYFSTLKKLSFVNLFGMLVDFLVFAINPILISKFFGPIDVACYNSAMIIFRFISQSIGILINPINNRLNQIFAKKNFDNLRYFLYYEIILFLPIVLFPTISIIIYAEPLIFCWLGEKYSLSIYIIQILMFKQIFDFFPNITGNLLFIMF